MSGSMHLEQATSFQKPTTKRMMASYERFAFLLAVFHVFVGQGFGQGVNQSSTKDWTTEPFQTSLLPRPTSPPLKDPFSSEMFFSKSNNADTTAVTIGSSGFTSEEQDHNAEWSTTDPELESISTTFQKNPDSDNIVSSLATAENTRVHPYKTAGDYIYKYGMTALFVFGSVGNTLALMVLFRSRLRHNSSSLYLMALGFIDQYNIFAAVLGSHVIRSYWDFDYIRHQRYLCKFAYFSIVTCAQSSFYLVACMSLERALVVISPLKFMTTFTRTRTKITIAVVLVVWALKNLHIFWSNGAVYNYDDVNGTKKLTSECGLVRRPESLYVFNLDFRPWLDYVITFTAAVVIIGCNAVIIYGVNRSMKSQKKLTVRLRSNSKAGNKINKARQMIPLLVSTSVAFLVLALPLQIVTLIWPQNPNDVSDASAALANMMWSIGLLMSYTNNVINFYVYCLSGSTFRREFRRVLHLTKNKKAESGTTSSISRTVQTRVSSKC